MKIPNYLFSCADSAYNHLLKNSAGHHDIAPIKRCSHKEKNNTMVCYQHDRIN